MTFYSSKMGRLIIFKLHFEQHFLDMSVLLTVTFSRMFIAHHLACNLYNYMLHCRMDIL